MELYQIKTFVVVADEGNLTRAAELLHASQSTISLHIKALEEKFSIRLFKRSAKGMQLTEEGRVLLGKARSVLSEAESFKQTAANLSGEVRGEARVGLHTSPTYLRTAEIIKCIKNSYPGLTLSLNQSSTWTIRKDIAASRLEAGFFYSINAPEEISAVLLERPVLKVVGPVSWRDRIEDATWQDLSDMPWIWTPPECSFHQQLSQEFASRGLDICKVMVADSEDTHSALVRSENGLTLMRADEAAEEEAKGSVCIWNGGALCIGLFFGYNTSMSRDPVVHALLECVRMVWNPEP